MTLNFWKGDVEHLIYSNPHNHAPILQDIMRRIGDYKSPDAMFVDMLKNDLGVFYNLQKFSSVQYLFVSFSLFAPKKVIGDYASELWLNATTRENIDQEELGKVLAQIINEEWLPIRRLNTLIEDRLIDISKHHSLALSQLIDSIVANVDKPVREVKKILELLHKVQSSSNYRLSNEAIISLTKLSGVSSLKKICDNTLRHNNTTEYMNYLKL